MPIARSQVCKTRAPGAASVGPDAGEVVRLLELGEEGLLIADIDLTKKALAKHDLDNVGQYSRPDLLSLRVRAGRYISRSSRFEG